MHARRRSGSGCEYPNDGILVIAAAAAPPVPVAQTPRWVTLVAVAVWLATLLVGLAVQWVGFGTDYLQGLLTLNVGSTNGAGDLGILRLTMAAFSAITLGYSSVGALLVGRPGAGRIGGILLAGGALFALIPFGYMVGGFLTLELPSTSFPLLITLIGPAAIGPGLAMILPVLAIAFPDGRLPSPRWARPVALALTALGLASVVQIVRPDALVGGSLHATNPIGIDALPEFAGPLAGVATGLGIVVLTAMGTIAAVVRYRRGTSIERQQTRWFVAAVALAAVPLSLSFVPPFGGPASLLVASVGLILIPVAVGIAVARYRLYEIDRLISRTLVYVPLTALVAGLYAGVVALLQRVFQAVTGDRSDAAIVISTLILASVFTPLRKWLEVIVDRRFKPAVPEMEPIVTAQLVDPGGDWDDRMEAIALRVVRSELDSRPRAERSGRHPG